MEQVHVPYITVDRDQLSRYRKAEARGAFRVVIAEKPQFFDRLALVLAEIMRLSMRLTAKSKHR